MNTTEQPATERSDGSNLPRWLVLIIALFFWIILLPLVHAGIPCALSLLAPRYGWTDGRPGIWNLLGLIPIAVAVLCLIWLMILHFSSMPVQVKLERTPSYLMTRGPYTFTRNPMYLAEMALWLGWTIFYGSPPVLIALLILGTLINWRIVTREERDLEVRFGETYLEYKRRVPRWL